MTAPLTQDQQRLIQLATNIANADILTRRVDITEMVNIIHRITQIELRPVVEAVNNPTALRYLITAGLPQDVRARAINKLQELAAIGIK